MKSCIIDSQAETRLDLECMPIHLLLEENYFATVPIITIRPLPTKRDEEEEELYTSFEEAISDRVARVSGQLERLPRSSTSRELHAVRWASHATTELAPACPPSGTRLRWRETITLICLALSMMLLGFDLMGLLVLRR